MSQSNPMLGVAVAAMRWHHARLRRLEAEKACKQATVNNPLRIGLLRLEAELADARRLESRYKRRLSQSCEKASDKKPQIEVIDV